MVKLAAFFRRKQSQSERERERERAKTEVSLIHQIKIDSCREVTKHPPSHELIGGIQK